MSKNSDLAAIEQDMKDTGERIERARKARGLNQTELGELVGMNQATVVDYEAGSLGMKMFMILKIAAALNVSKAYITGFNDDELSWSEVVTKKVERRAMSNALTTPESKATPEQLAMKRMVEAYQKQSA